MVNCFDLHNNGIFHQQVNTITTIQSHVAVDHGQGLLTLNPEPFLNQLILQACLIRRLQKPRP